MKLKPSRSHFILAIPPAVLLVLTLLYWKYRIIDTAVDQWISLYTGDLYNQYYPMVSYGFSSLRAGRLPLWNPFQLCGVPFLGVPYVGLFYPANLIYLFVDVSTGIELVFILHMFFAAVSMWCLQRHFGITSLGGLCSALTFAWSGWLIFNANQIPLYAGMAWMPVTVLLFDRASNGRRSALIGLIVSVAFQLLLGATETLVHNLHVGAFFACARLAAIVRQNGWAAFLRRAALLAAGVVAGVLLAAFQLLPTLELTSLSNRAAGEQTYADAVAVSRPVWWVLFHSIGGPPDVDLGLAPFPVTGLLPFLGIFLAFGNRVSRRVWLGALIVSIVSLLLASGDPFYRLYYALPWGAIFRRPEKLLSVYQFGQALLAGVAISQLQSWRGLKRSELWTRPEWLSAFGLAAILAGFGWGVTIAHQYMQVASERYLLPYPFSPADFALTLQTRVLVAIFGLMVAYGCLASTRGRTVAVGCILLIQAANLFFATGSKTDRPVRQDWYGQSLQLKHYLRELPGYFRTYLFPSGSGYAEAGFTPKDATMHGFVSVTDYDALLLARYRTFFDRVVGPARQSVFFTGTYPLFAEARWRLMSLTSTKYYVASGEHPATRFLRAKRVPSPFFHAPPEFRPIYENDALRIYETHEVVPRAYLVPEARVIEDPNQLLNALDDPSFNPRNVVLLEEAALEQPISRRYSEIEDSVRIVQYQPEEVLLEVSSKDSGYLVLTDAFYPGWKALVNGVETKIYRANYLFRSVPLQAGKNTVRFLYRPTTFRVGVLLSALCAIGLTILFGRDLWLKRSR